MDISMECISELEAAIIEAEGIKDILGMLSDCATEGAQSLDNYKMGFALLYGIAVKNVKDLNRAKDGLIQKFKETIK
ncbi:MAG: hypothetical protein PUD24_02750 [Oscillospiraceae bacterium]|nr:hypothetical protein [Oscillospiraceae bacterium]